jgi:pSer/pThr/pTyr-binding forkhead associated (FHA) protein
MRDVSANPPAGANTVSDLKARAEAERSGRPFLLFRDGSGSQRLFLFDEAIEQVSVGRQSSADVVLDWDDQVSRLHARLERGDHGWEVVDDGLSRNGTFVNDERLGGRRRLSDGDTVRFGGTTVTFHAPGRGQAAAQGRADVGLSTSQRRVLVALCRPYVSGVGSGKPATDQEIAEELFLSGSAVRAQLQVLYAKLGVEAVPEDRARVRLVERAFSAGLISERDL